MIFINNAKEIWFIYYVVLLAILMIAIGYFDVLALFIALGIVLLVDKGIWPKSKQWIESSTKFRLMNRYLIGGYLLVTYFFGRYSNMEEIGFTMMCFTPFIIVVERELVSNTT